MEEQNSQRAEPSAADLDAAAKDLTIADLTAIPSKPVSLKQKELDDLDAQIKAEEQRQHFASEQEKLSQSLDAQIAEKRRTLSELHAKSGTVAHYPDTHIHREPLPAQPEGDNYAGDGVHIDARGNRFDPEIHATDGDTDRPYRDSSGTFVKKELGYTPPKGVQNFVKP